MTDNWKTPEWLMTIFKHWFDPCPANADFNGLNIDWADKTYCNPPYSSPLPWVKKAIEENEKGCYIVMLLRLDCSTTYFRLLMEAGAHTMFINERLKFSDGKGSSPFPSALFILI